MHAGMVKALPNCTGGGFFFNFPLMPCKQANHARRYGEGIARLHRGEFLKFPPMPCKQAKHARRHGEDLARLHRG